MPSFGYRFTVSTLDVFCFKQHQVDYQHLLILDNGEGQFLLCGVPDPMPTDVYTY